MSGSTFDPDPDPFFQMWIWGSGSTITERWIRGSGSTIPKCGSQDSDTRQKEMDPQRCLATIFSKLRCIVYYPVFQESSQICWRPIDNVNKAKSYNSVPSVVFSYFWRTSCGASTGCICRSRWGCPWLQIELKSLFACTINTILRVSPENFDCLNVGDVTGCAVHSALFLPQIRSSASTRF